MEKYYGIAAIAGICVLVLFMGMMKQKARVVSVFVLRSFVGVAAICGMNEILKSQGIAVAAGVNPVSILTIGSLGISGFALIYGILFYRLL